MKQVTHVIGTKAKIVKVGAKKASQLVHKGLNIADKVTGKTESIAKKIRKGADKMSGIPMIGEVAGLVGAGAHQIQSVAHLGKKGVKGLEKIQSKVEKGAKKYSKRGGHKFREGTTLAVQKIDEAERGVKKAKGKIKAGKTRIKSAGESIHNEVNDARNKVKKLFR